METELMTGSLATSEAPVAPGVPLVVQLGFAGSRTLFDERAHPQVRVEDFADALLIDLKKRLRDLPSQLGLSDRHFLCGLSQLAVGADTIFTRALLDLNWPQRFFLPQNREDFIAGVGSEGKPDFDARQRDTARTLFGSSHAIQERVVSDSPSRHTRFQDVNREIVRASDVMVCLVSEADASKPGGTTEVIEEARRRNRAVLRIDVAVGQDGRPQVREAWQLRHAFVPPALPEELAGLASDIAGMPRSVSDYCQPLKLFASSVSKLRSNIFRTAALVIIGTHLCATMLAVSALQIHEGSLLSWLLGGELVLLALGFATHQYLHRSQAVRGWAMARLVAEIARSARAMRDVPGYLGHFFALPLPSALRPLLRTLNVLHLRDTRTPRSGSLEDRRNSYIRARLVDPTTGQIPYYERKLKAAASWMSLANGVFLVASGLAIVATLFKALMVFGYLHVPDERHEALASLLGSLAVILPIFAVGALSLAASHDLEARVHTYGDTLTFLRKQEQQLATVTSETSLSALVLETEAYLLGENANWYARRAFTSVT
jgi:hypothetical protein